MRLDSKNIRYFYWISSAFFKKNFLALLLSSLATLIVIILIVTFSPFVLKILTTPTETIGIAGEYTTSNLPDEISQKLSNGLIHIDENGNVIPVLAEDWEVSNDGREFKFKIKNNLSWNDDALFTAKQINYKFKDVTIETPNDTTITFKLKSPLAIFPQFLIRPIIKEPMIGVAGLYSVDRTKISQGRLVSLSLSPNKAGHPLLVYKFYDTEDKLIEAYKLGEIKSFKTERREVALQFEDFNNTFVQKSIDYSKVIAIFFNFNFPLFKEEKDLRHAIAEAIDKSKFQELGEIALGPVPPVSWAYDEAVLRAYPYNPNVAGKIIKKYQDEASISAQIKLTTYYEHLNVADDIKKTLTDAGLPITVEVVSGGMPKDFQLFLAKMNLGSDPDQYFFWHSTQQDNNITTYRNVRVDKLLEDGRTTFGITKRKPIYSDFQRILVEDMPAHFLYHPHQYIIRRR
jgi:peptide/nickel transport system substrate-binding protein